MRFFLLQCNELKIICIIENKILISNKICCRNESNLFSILNIIVYDVDVNNWL